MPISCNLKFESPDNWTSSPDSPGGELIYVITSGTGGDAVTQEAALAALTNATAPELTIGTHTVTKLSVTVHRVNGNTFTGTVRYGFSSGRHIFDTGESTRSFSTMGETIHIDNSIATVQTYGEYWDVDGLINVRFKKNTDPTISAEYLIESIDGVDIVVPVFSFSETHWKVAEDVDDAYMMTVMELTGKVNDNTFRGFAAGEVLFLGAELDQRKVRGDYEIKYHFSVKKNKTNLSVGSITGIAKKGWEYLWIIKDEDTEGNPYISSVSVEQVYEYGNFAGLNI